MSENKRMNKKNIVIVAALGMMLLIGTAVAFFTDTDTATNAFTVGNISIDLQEPNWNPDNGKDITPNKVIAKDPKIVNDGANDAFVFLKVNVPAANVKTANEDGSLNAAARQDLFTYTVNNGWKQISKIEETDNTTYVYAYVGTDGNMNALASKATTPALFDNVKFINAVEGQITDTNLEIVIDSMGIQTTDLGTTDPTEVYNILVEGLEKADK